MRMHTQAHMSIYIYIYTYIHPQTDYFVVSQLFRVTRQARFPKLGSRPDWIKLESEILPLSHKEVVSINLFSRRILLYSPSHQIIFLPVRFEVVEQQMWNYSSYVYEEKKKFSGEGRQGQNNWCYGEYDTSPSKEIYTDNFTRFEFPSNCTI